MLFVCGLSPYNDWVVNNTFIVGNFLPIGLLLFFVLIVLLINAPLYKWAPRLALSPGELTIAMAMTLVSCGIPGAGIMRYLPPQLVGLWYWAGQNPDHTAMMNEMQLPDWLFPAYESADARERMTADVTQHYYVRVPGTDGTFVAQFLAVPWGAWIKPAVAWSLFTFSLLGALLCLLLIVRRQWTENERLTFPLASIYASVLEPPERGKVFNSLFCSRSFWVAFGVVFLIHGCNALKQYWPMYFPIIPIRFDLHDVFSEEPWRYAEYYFKRATLFFTIVGICYFLPSQISLSVWFFYVLVQISIMAAGSYRLSEYTWSMRADQFSGAVVPYGAVLIWVGRQHWATVIRQMFRGHRGGESFGRYLPYAAIGWGFVGFSALGIGFLCAAGASLIGATVAMGCMLTLHLMVARIVAETGMPFVNFPGTPISRFWLYGIDSQGHGLRTTMRSHFLTQMMGSIYVSDIRESPAVYTSHAYRLADDVYADGPQPKAWRRALPFTLCVLLAIVVGFYASGVGKLYTEYTHTVTLDESQRWPLDAYGTNQNIRENTLNRAFDYRPPSTGPRETHSKLGHFAFGAGVSTVLSIARLKSASFPFHPVGFLLCASWPVGQIWFSMLVGWLLKVLIVRFGGTELYRKARPFFIGLILGEAGAGSFWLITSLILNALGLPYKSIFLLST